MVWFASTAGAQWEIMDAARGEVDFSKQLQPWDGFGFNYVEVPQTLDYDKDPQEYGGFSLLTEAERQRICDLVFGEDGLKPGVVKMFFDPFHQKAPGAQGVDTHAAMLAEPAAVGTVVETV
jgi:hypothetical protein